MMKLIFRYNEVNFVELFWN